MEIIHKNANQLFIDGEFEKANQLYTELLDTQYKPDIMYSNKAACFLKVKEYKLSLDNALKSTQINLNNSVAWGRIGYSYKGLKMFTESIKAFEIAHKLNKNNENYLKELIFLHKRFNNKVKSSNIKFKYL
jgi:tetratricopeptide (TPR) repeat protein